MYTCAKSKRYIVPTFKDDCDVIVVAVALHKNIFFLLGILFKNVTCFLQLRPRYCKGVLQFGLYETVLLATRTQLRCQTAGQVFKASRTT